jgi:hypothetical protein
MKEIAAARPRYGYRRIHTLLRREGWKDGIDRVYRLYRLDGLAVRSKPRKKRRAVARVRPAVATAPRERWAIDFIHDVLVDGRPFRVLPVVDVFSRSTPGAYEFRQVKHVAGRVRTSRLLTSPVQSQRGGAMRESKVPALASMPAHLTLVTRRRQLHSRAFATSHSLN